MSFYKKLIIFVVMLSLVSFSSYASDSNRIGSTDKSEMILELKAGIKEFRAENNDELDLVKFKPLLSDNISDYYDMRLVTLEEFKIFEVEYDKLAANSSNLSSDKKSSLLVKLAQESFNTLNSKPLSKLKEGEICNLWDCEKGLVCAMEPIHQRSDIFQTEKNSSSKVNSCLSSRGKCSNDSDCCSNFCEIAPGERILNSDSSKKKIGSCQPVMKCFKPVKLNGDCSQSPICENGSCLPVNRNRSGIDECVEDGEKATSKDLCCSDKIEKNVCVPNLICKLCTEQGAKPTRGVGCCEGLYEGIDGKCVRRLPPLVVPEFSLNSENSLFHSTIRSIASFFISSANAQLGAIIDEDTQSSIDMIKGGASGKLGASNYGTEDYSVEGLKEKQAANAADAAAKSAAESGGKKYQVDCAPDDLQCIEQKKIEYKAELNSHMKTPEFPIGPKSDFETCEINFRNDYFWLLKDQNLLDFEFTLAGFEYVMLGDGVEDYWKEGGKSIRSRLHDIAVKHQEDREKVYEKIGEEEKRLQCICYDRIGYPNLPKLEEGYIEKEEGEDKEEDEEEDEAKEDDENKDDEDKEDEKKVKTEKQEWFEENCSDHYAIYLEELASFQEQFPDYNPDEDYVGDASGVKYKILLVEWTEALKNYYDALAVINQNTFTETYTFSKLANSFNWNITEHKKEELFKFTVYPYNGENPTSESLGYSLGAILAAGAVAIIAGIAGPAIMSAWAAAGIVTAGAVTGWAAQLMIYSLAGAWVDLPPVVEDEIYKQSYKCTKKGHHCQDYQRFLHQPVNNVCGSNMPFSSNACVKHFLKIDGTHVIVDPWIPWEASWRSFIKDAVPHVDRLKAGGDLALSELKEIGPQEVEYGNFGNIKPCYLDKTFIDGTRAGLFAPKLLDTEWTYDFGERGYKVFMANAKRYIVHVGLLPEEEVEAQTAFAEYALKYHFMWPKTAVKNTVMYPPPGLLTYLDLIAYGFGMMTANSLELNQAYDTRLKQYEADLENTIEGLNKSDTTLSGGTGVTSLVDKQLAAANGDYKTSAFSTNTITGATSSETNAIDQNALSSSDSDNLEGQDVSAGSLDAQSAARAYNKIRDEQKKVAEHYKKSIKGTVADKLIADRQAAMISRFFKPSLGASGKGLISSASSDSSSLKSGKVSATSSKGNAATNRSAKYKKGTYGVKKGGSNSFGYKPTSPSASSGVNGNGTGNKNGEQNLSHSDQGKVGSTIDALNRGEKVDDSNGNGLFDLVTRAYIKSYKKLFPSLEEVRDIEQN